MKAKDMKGDCPMTGHAMMGESHSAGVTRAQRDTVISFSDHFDHDRTSPGNRPSGQMRGKGKRRGGRSGKKGY